MRGWFFFLEDGQEKHGEEILHLSDDARVASGGFAYSNEYEGIEKRIINSGKKNPYLTVMKYIVKRNEFVRDLRRELEEGNKWYPPPDKEKTRIVLESLRTSRGELGEFTHTRNDFTFQRGMKILLERYYPHKFYLPGALQNTFDEHVKVYERIGVEYGEDYNLDVMFHVDIHELVQSPCASGGAVGAAYGRDNLRAGRAS